MERKNRKIETVLLNLIGVLTWVSKVALTIAILLGTIGAILLSFTTIAMSLSMVLPLDHVIIAEKFPIAIVFLMVGVSISLIGLVFKLLGNYIEEIYLKI